MKTIRQLTQPVRPAKSKAVFRDGTRRDGRTPNQVVGSKVHRKLRSGGDRFNAPNSIIAKQPFGVKKNLPSVKRRGEQATEGLLSSACLHLTTRIGTRYTTFRNGGAF